MRRRDLIALAVGVAVFRPRGGRAQSPQQTRRVGMLIALPEDDPLAKAFAATFSQALAQMGWAEGRNIRIDDRFAGNDPELLLRYGAELVSLAPDAILASTAVAALALREATRTVPIVFTLTPDPVGLGFVKSLAHPGENITGFSSYDTPVFVKWLQLLKEVAPGITRVAVIFNPDVTSVLPYVSLFSRAMEAAAPPLGVTVSLTPVRDDAAIEDVAAALGHQPGAGLITLPDVFLASHRDTVIAAANRHGLPLMGMGDVFTRAGGLMSYGFDPVAQHAQAASYVDRILKGAKPADLPVQQPARFSLIINIKTAAALGFTVPPSLLARADEVIE